MDAERILAFRLARVGLAGRAPGGLAGAVACPASDFHRDAGLLAVSARRRRLTRAAYDEAVDAGDLVVAHVVRGAIHVLAPDDLALYGRALVATDDDELAKQIGRQFTRITTEHGIAPTAALAEVTAATKDALAGGAALGKVDLHQALRERVRPELMPWCKGCQSHHVAPMLWRYATVEAGARLDAGRRYRLGRPGRTPPADEAVRRFLRWYGPARPGGFADWAGLRPMTELEFTKAARGPADPVASDYPWGTSSKAGLLRRVGPDDDLVQAGAADESRLTDSTREALGASYYWVMDLAGSVWERAVTIGHPRGRAFRGTHGDGMLRDYGLATNDDWPLGDHEAGGYGYRGGGHYERERERARSTTARELNPHSPVEWRNYGSWGGGPRGVAYGFRAVRTADASR